MANEITGPMNPQRQLRWGGVLSAPIPSGRDYPPARNQPSLPDALGAESHVTGLPGANFAPAGSTGVDVSGDADLAAGASVALLTYTVPDGARLRIAGIGFGADDEVCLRFLTWSIRVNGDTIPGYFQQNAAVGSIRNLTDIFVLVGVSAVVTIFATADATAVLVYRYIARIRGWLYTDKEGS